MKKIFNETSKYKLLSVIRYLGDGFFYPFFALYLKNKGLVEDKIGFLLSVSPLLAIILNPIYSKICKNVKTTKNTLGIISILEGIMILFISLSSNFYLITALVVLMAIFGSCHYGLLDSLTAIYCDSNNLKYSGIRLYGSASYIVATAVGGYICNSIDFKLAFIISSILFALSGIVYFLMKDITLKTREETKKYDEKEKKSYIELFKNGKFIFFVIFYCILMGTVATTNNFLSTYLEERGLNSSQYGLIYSYFVAFEVITLLILSKIKVKISSSLLLFISALTLLIRTYVCYIYAPMSIIIIFLSFRGIGYALILHVTYQYVIDLIGEKWATFGIMMTTLAYSIYVFIFNNLNGQVISNYSYKAYYLLNTIMSLIALILSLIPFIGDIIKKYKNKKLTN